MSRKGDVWSPGVRGDHCTVPYYTRGDQLMENYPSSIVLQRGKDGQVESRLESIFSSSLQWKQLKVNDEEDVTEHF